MYRDIITEEFLPRIAILEGIIIREFKNEDYPFMQKLYEKEGWMSFITRKEDRIQAWKNSSIAIVAIWKYEIVGFVMGLTDGKITTYIAEIIIDIRFRGKGLGRVLINVCHDMYTDTRIDLLST